MFLQTNHHKKPYAYPIPHIVKTFFSWWEPYRNIFVSFFKYAIVYKMTIVTLLLYVINSGVKYFSSYNNNIHC